MVLNKYTEINELIKELLNGIQAVLGNKLAGLYLYGSLAIGDFDENISDIDLLCATTTNIDENDFEKLDQMHKWFVQKYEQWNDRLEIAYLSIDTLQSPVIQQDQIAIISPGEPFNIKKIGADWLINFYVIREQGITICGDDSKKIIKPISKQEFIDAVKSQALEWRDWISHTKYSRSYQGYAILTMCRALYACKTGKQPSKINAALWAMKELPELTEQIQAALQWRKEYKRMDINHESTYPETLKFVNCIIDMIIKG